MQSLSALPDVGAAARRWALVGPILRVLAEAGFFSVVYATAAVVIGGHPPFLGPIEFTLLVGGGAVVGSLARENPEIGAIGLIGAVAGGGVLGWVAGPETRDLLAIDALAALGAHGIGWLGAVAVLRGSFIHGAGTADGIEQLLRWFLPDVAVLWALATILALPALWPSFAVYALWGSLTMIVAGLAAIGLIRLGEVHGGLAETRVRRMWRWLVVAAAVSVVPLSIPFVVLSGIPLGTVFSPISEPLLVVVGLLALPLALLVELLLGVLQPIFRGLGSGGSESVSFEILPRVQEILRNTGSSLGGTLIGIVLAAMVVIVLAIAIYALARWIVRRDPYAELDGGLAADVVEHAIVIPVSQPSRPRAAARQRRAAAHDAVSAYISAVESLAVHPDWARSPAETPALHSLRVRAADMPGADDFSRLAADYQLARYAERPITPREDRRALSRLDRLRRLLR